MFAENTQEELDSQDQSLEEDVAPSTEEVDNTDDIEETPAEEETEDDEPSYTEHERKLYKRARKAEAEAKEATARLEALERQAKKPKKKSTPSSPLTTNIRDLKAVVDLEDDDAEFVINYAEKFGMSISEARKDKDVKAALGYRAEERKTAEATSTGTGRRGSSRLSDDKLMEKAEAGEIPDSMEDLKRLAASRLKARKQS